MIRRRHPLKRISLRRGEGDFPGEEGGHDFSDDEQAHL
jgi:hypothetical protein